jgi:glutamate dehydrogenase
MTSTEKIRRLQEERSEFANQIQELYDTLCTSLDFSDFTPDLVADELEWYYNLGFDDYYFHTTLTSQIAKHVQALYAAKLLAKVSRRGLRLERVSSVGPIYACRSNYEEVTLLEKRMLDRYPNNRLQCYRTTEVQDDVPIRVYFLSPCKFPEGEVDENETDIRKIATINFLERNTDTTIERYQSILTRAVNQPGVCIETSDKPESNETRLMIAFRSDSTHSYFLALSDLLHYYDLQSNRKYIEHFANGFTVYSIYLDSELKEKTSEALKSTLAEYKEEQVIDSTLEQTESKRDLVLKTLREEASMLYVLPRTSLTRLFQSSKLSAQAVTYAYAAWKFTHLFLSKASEEYAVLKNVLYQQNPAHLGVLARLRKNLRLATYSEGRILETLLNYPELLGHLYADFASKHTQDEPSVRAPSDIEPNKELHDTIVRTVLDEIDQQVLLTVLKFNNHVLRTNFYKDDKVALGFRLNPNFLDSESYPEVPFGIFFFVGSEFRGFHVRFRDVARGGIRIIRSRNPQVFGHNTNTLFDENYNLAYTQQKKNKDIPEGGSKGTILLSLEHQDKAESAFRKYIDTMLDLLLPHPMMVNYSPQEEILFLGPDEGTADLMDWASIHSRQRGYGFSKAFTTGKSVSIGGIPHDLYGMTTLSVHEYVLGILAKLGIREEDVTKIQTGGPDGDLGSNEIKISKDKTIAIVDGSGVLYDPNGLDREELNRLADLRQMVTHFNRERLSEGGFLVLVSDKDISLPDGSHVESGLHFRNEFHLSKYAKADFFVPCGGRPESINSRNVDRLFDEDGRPKFKYIVEGANLFLTQEARLVLEEAGVIVFKDASANKGGVTSSSQEVLASLALSPEEFPESMQVVGGNIPDFYATYVEAVQERIKENARMEFECIWREYERTSIPRSVLTDQVSKKINYLNDTIQQSNFLWENMSLRRYVLEHTIPDVLIDKVGLDHLFERVPDNYLKAIFSSHLASHYVYKFGMDASELAFFEFIQDYFKKSQHPNRESNMLLSAEHSAFGA